VVQEVAAVDEQQQSLTIGLWGLKLTIPAPASITHMALGSSTQSKGKRKVTEEAPSVSQYAFFHSLLTFICRLRFSSCNSCTIAGIPCLMEMQKNKIWWMSYDRCWQRKMVCHWDLVGIMGPWDPNMSKWAHRTVKKPVINV
jgi:hypothetical protein